MGSVGKKRTIKQKTLCFWRLIHPTLMQIYLDNNAVFPNSDPQLSKTM